MIWGYCQVGAGVITGFSVGVAVLAASVFTVSALLPSRFVPIYEMYNVAEEVGDTATAAALAREILAKPVKVPSRETLEMIEDVRRREAARVGVKPNGG